MNEFDKMLYEISEEAAEQSSEITQRIQPWRKMFNLLIWGMMVLLFEINIFGGIFNYLLSYARPLIGCILIIKGLAICKSENRYFKRAYISGCGYYIYVSVSTVILALPIHQRIPEGISVFTLIAPLISIIIMYNLFRALKQVIDDDSDSNKKINQIFWDIICLILSLYLICFIGYYLQKSNVVVYISFLIVLILYIYIIKKISRLKNILDERGYAIQVTKKSRRYGTNIFILCDLVITIVLILYFVNYCSSLPVTIHEIDVETEMLATDMSEVEIDEVKERLISMGMERYIAEDLLPEDIKKLKNVKQLLISSTEQDFPYAGARLKVTCYLGELRFSEQKMEDSNYIDGIYVDALVLYFEWMDEPDQPYAEVLIEDYMQRSSWYVDCSADLSRWIHIANVGEEKIYYGSNEKSYIQTTNIFGHEDTSIRSGTNIIKNASKYRSYIVRRCYSTYYYERVGDRDWFTLSLSFQYAKEQKTYPYCSIYDVVMFGTLPTLEEMIIGPQYGYSNSLSGVLDYSVNNVQINFTIDRYENDHSLSALE